MSLFGRFKGLSSISAGLALCAGLPIAAQAQVSRPVVQALPDAASDRLNGALRNLARNPRSLPDLIDAGEAALELEDGEAALGFFLRAEEVQPAYGRATAGKAAALVLLERPVEALAAFGQAEGNGAVMSRFDAWHGLAWDLVGDNARAQGLYRNALARGPDPVVTRRLALSLAISGDEAGMESVLLPLLQGQDLAAFRTRAFALAILGKQDEAMTIAGSVLPPRVASQIEPYLRYMPRLTRSQQAAAANLGIFPTASRIGIDTPEIAAYSRNAAPVQVARADADRLSPSGQPLGRTSVSGGVPVQQETRAQRQERERREQRDRRRAERRAKGGTLTINSSTPIEAPTEQQPPATQVAVAEPALDDITETGELPARTNAPVEVAQVETIPVRQAEPATTPEPIAEPEPVVVARTEVVTQPAVSAPAVAVEPVPGPSFSLTERDEVPAAAAPEPQGLADAFSDFSLTEGRSATPATGAVDITTIDPQREVSRPAEPAPPAQPSRHWVQVATGRDISALAFDWRRIVRTADGVLEGREAYTASWGQTNRLVTGPYDSASAANAAVRDLKEKGVDSFRFTSAEGETVTPLD